MIKPIFTIKNIFIAILCCIGLTFTIPFVIIPIYGIFTDFKEIKEEIGIIKGFIGFGIFIWLYGWLSWLLIEKLREQLIPKYFKCLKAVRKYINLEELKEIIEKEQFVRDDFSELRAEKNHENEIYISKNWIFARGTYIPKAMIYGMHRGRYKGQRGSKCYFELLNKTKIKFLVDVFYTSPERYVMKKHKIPNIRIASLSSNYVNFEKQQLERFKNEIQTKEDFLKLIENDFYFTRKDLKEEFYEEQEEVKRYFYDRKSNKYYEEFTDAVGNMFIEEILYEDIDKKAEIEEFSLEEYFKKL